MQRIVHVAVEREVVGATAQLALAVQAIEQDGLDSVYNLSRLHFHLGDGTGDVLLFVGKEVVLVALARHVVFPHQAVQRCLHLLAQGNGVGAHVVHHKDGDVAQRGFQVANVAHQVQQLQNAHVFGLQALAGFGGALGAVHHHDYAVLQVLRNGVEEAPERHQRGKLIVLHRLRRFLEGREHGALTGRHVLRLDTMLADLVHHVGQQLELVAHERVRIGEVELGFIAAHVGARPAEGEQVAKNRALVCVFVLQHCCCGWGFLQHAALDNLVHAGAGKGKARVEAALDLGKVVTHHHGYLVDGFLAGNHHPHAALAAAAQLFHQGLQVQHQALVAADELAHFVHHEQQAEVTAVFRGLGLHVVANLLGEAVGGDGVVFRAVEPVAGLGFAPAQHFLQHFHDVVFEVRVAFARFHPRIAVHALEGFAELLGFALAVDEFFQLGKLQVFAVEAAAFVEHALERTQQRGLRRVAFLPLAALAVDVEQDGFGGNLGAAAHAAVHQGVFHLAVEVVDGAHARHFLVGQQVGKHLQEVGFTGTEEARDPHAYLVGGHVDGAIVVLEEGREVALQFASYHVFGKLLLDGFAVVLLDLHHAVDRAVDVLREQVFDNHSNPLERSKAR